MIRFAFSCWIVGILQPPSLSPSSVPTLPSFLPLLPSDRVYGRQEELLSKMDPQQRAQTEAFLAGKPQLTITDASLQ